MTTATSEAPEGNIESEASETPGAATSGTEEAPEGGDAPNWEAKFKDVQASRDKYKARLRQLEERTKLLEAATGGQDLYAELLQLRSQKPAPSDDGATGGDELEQLRAQNRELSERLSSLDEQHREQVSNLRRGAIEGAVLAQVPDENHEAARLVLSGMAGSLDDGEADPGELASRALETLRDKAPQLFGPKTRARSGVIPHDMPGGVSASTPKHADLFAAFGQKPLGS